jgi:hypothetical protein
MSVDYYDLIIEQHRGGITMKKNATSIGIIGIPDDAIINKLEKEWGKPIKKIEKDGKIILPDAMKYRPILSIPGLENTDRGAV